jgi:alanine racemase
VDDPRRALTTNWAEVDVAALRENARYLCEVAGERCEVMAVVKANGYGHGAVTAAEAALAGGVTWLAVSSMAEALELRGAGIDARVLNIGWTMPTGMAAAIDHDIDVAVFEPADVAAARNAARGRGRPLRVHWKIDTGMGGLGTRPEDVATMVSALLDARGAVEVVGVFTHFASADEDAVDSTMAQLACFVSMRPLSPVT